MNTERHPLIKHLNKKGESLTSFAKRSSLSRAHLYRIMNGEGTTTASLNRISEATGWEVPVAALIPDARKKQAKRAEA